MGFADYLHTVRKLNNMGRWATEFMHRRATVSEHSFFVAQIGQMLGVIEEQHGNAVNWRKLFFRLINHDVTESMTGDIISTTKHKNPEIRSMVERIEEELAEEMIHGLDSRYQDIYREILFEGKDETLEGRVLRDADRIDALIECLYEVKLCNFNPFREKYGIILEKLRQSDLVSTRYFIENILPELTAKAEIET